MDFQTAILTAILAAKAHYTDHESDNERLARMTIIAQAINIATLRAACEAPFDAPGCKPIFSDRRMLAGLLIGKGRYESGFALYVHEGRCSEGPVGARCDAGRAHGPWQEWMVAVHPRADWDAMVGTSLEATSLAAWHAATHLAGAKSTCRSTFPGDDVSASIVGFSGSCTLIMRPEKVAMQARTVRGIMNMLPDPRVQS